MTQNNPRRCCTCGRTLKDDKSREIGMGPDCAKKYGYGEISGNSDFGSAIKALQRATLASMAFKANGEQDLAKTIVRRIAKDRKNPDVPAMVDALRHLGWVKLSDALTTKLIKRVRISVWYDDGRLWVKTPKNEGARLGFRNIPGWQFDGGKIAWHFPLNDRARKRLWAVLCEHFRGYAGRGPNGLFTVGATARMS
jgi:hypothetical protein